MLLCAALINILYSYWMAMNLCKDIHGAKRKKHEAFGEPLSFQPAPPACQIFPSQVIFFNIYKMDLHIFKTFFFYTVVHVFQMMNPNDYGDPLMFSGCPHEVYICGFD